MRFSSGGRALERLAGPAPGSAPPVARRWHTVRSGPDPWRDAGQAPDQEWARRPPAGVARTALQQGLLFPLARVVARPRVLGAEDLLHAPQPAVIAPNHASDIDTPLILAALPQAWRTRTLVGAAADRFYRRRSTAVMASLWINTFSFDRGGDLRGLARAADLLHDGWNVLLYPQATRSAGQLAGFRAGVARLCLATNVPLIPVHVDGTALIMPKDRGLLQRGRATVAFGAPIFPSEGEHPQDLMQRTRTAITALAERRARPTA
jgi:1-acyl-sn-glycerol-3-phosphate acyltransferase